MNISKREQRALHLLAQGGRIAHERDDHHKVKAAICFSRDGLALADFDLALFARLRARGFIASRAGAPYRISQRGLGAVRGQIDNQ